MAATVNLTLDQGANMKVNFTVKMLTNEDLPWDAVTNPYVPIDITGSQIYMYARKTYDDPAIAMNFSTVNGKFTITDGPNGLFSLVLLPSDTQNVRFTGDSFDYVYDIEVHEGTDLVYRVFQGTLTLTRESTRPI